MEKAKEIEQEQVTIKVPRNVMNLLRAYAKQGLGMTANEYLECTVLQGIRADLDADVFTIEPEEIARLYDLNSALSILA